MTLKYAGLTNAQMDAARVAQRPGSRWCWAASIETVLRCYGLGDCQEQIVACAFGTDALGRLPNTTATEEEVTAILTNMRIVRGADEFTVSATYQEGCPTRALVSELLRERPLIAAVRVQDLKHAIVCTAVAYREGLLAPLFGPDIEHVRARDPDPRASNSGLVEIPGSRFREVCYASWSVQVNHVSKMCACGRRTFPMLRGGVWQFFHHKEDDSHHVAQLSRMGLITPWPYT